MDVENMGIVAAVKIPDIRIAFEQLNLCRIANDRIKILIIHHKGGS